MQKGHKILRNVYIRVHQQIHQGHVEGHETATYQNGQWRKEGRRAEHALYAQGHADLHVQLIPSGNDAACLKMSIHKASLPKRLRVVF